jgi:phage/plasmid-like protein (TIGR03299 family)
MTRRRFDDASPYTPENERKGNRIVTSDGDRTIGGGEHRAYTAPVPWEGAGADVADARTVDGMMKLAGLDWEVEKTQLRDKHGPVPQFALRRKDNQEYLDTVGKAYVPVQNRPVFDFLKEFMQEGGAKMTVAGFIGGGKYVWGLADLGKSFKLPGKDEVKAFLLAVVPHVQGKKMVLKYTSHRISCNNQIASLIRRPTDKKGRQRDELQLPEFRHAHRTEFTGDAVVKAREVMSIARDQHEQFEEHARILQKKTMTREEAKAMLAETFAPTLDDEDLKAGKSTPRLEELMRILELAPGAQPDNAWGVLNAATYYATHVAGRSQDRRLQQSWMGKTGNQVAQLQRRLLAA